MRLTRMQSAILRSAVSSGFASVQVPQCAKRYHNAQRRQVTAARRLQALGLVKLQLDESTSLPAFYRVSPTSAAFKVSEQHAPRYSDGRTYSEAQAAETPFIATARELLYLHTNGDVVAESIRKGMQALVPPLANAADRACAIVDMLQRETGKPATYAFGD